MSEALGCLDIHISIYLQGLRREIIVPHKVAIPLGRELKIAQRIKVPIAENESESLL